MVCRLLVMSLGVMTQMSCLLSNPPDYDDPMNVVPVVLARRPQAPLYEIDKAKNQTTFRVDVRDNNGDQTLRFRWYLDYDREAFECGCRRSDDAPPLVSGEYESHYDLDHSIAALKAPSCHRLTVVITDGEWLENPDGRGCPTLVEEANKIGVDWYLGVYDVGAPATEVSFSKCVSLTSNNPLEELEL